MTKPVCALHFPASPLAVLQYDQPPLEYFLHVLHAKEWDTVTILTWSAKESYMNPTYTMLKMMADAGTLGDNVRLFKVGRLRSTPRETRTSTFRARRGLTATNRQGVPSEKCTLLRRRNTQW